MDPAVDTAAQTPFARVAALLDTMQAGPDRQTRIAHFCRFLDQWRATKGDTFPILRLFLPEHDRERYPLDIGLTTLADLYARALGLAAGHSDETALKRFPRQASARGRFAARGGSSGFYDALVGVLQRRLPPPGHGRPPSVADVNAHLDELKRARGRAARATVMEWFVRRLGVREHYWLARVILGAVSFGLSERTILDAYHPNAMERLQLCSDLKTVCTVFYNRPSGDSPLEDMAETPPAIEPMLPFEPQHLFRARSLAEIVTQMTSGEAAGGSDSFLIQDKLDGIKVIVHKRGREFRYFTRQRREPYAAALGAEPTPGSFTAAVAAALAPQVDSCILEGELLAYDTVHGDLEPFTVLLNTLGAAGTPGSDPLSQSAVERRQMILVAFDLLYLNGRPLAHVRYEDRMAGLRAVIPASPRALYPCGPAAPQICAAGRRDALAVLPSIPGRTAEDLESALARVREDGGEGIVLRNPRAPYRPGSRSWAAVKLKPSFVDGVGETVDCVLVGGYLGRGSAQHGGIASFLCALRADGTWTGASPRLVPFCRVARRLREQLEARVPLFPTDTEADSGSSKSAAYWTPAVRGAPLPPWLSSDEPSLYPVPDYFVADPAAAVVLELKAPEIIQSTEYPTRLTLRFPTIYAVRPASDKTWADAMSVGELRQAREWAPRGRLDNVGGSRSEASSESSGSRARPGPRPSGPLSGYDVAVLDVSAAPVGSEVIELSCQFFLGGASSGNVTMENSGIASTASTQQPASPSTGFSSIHTEPNSAEPTTTQQPLQNTAEKSKVETLVKEWRAATTHGDRCDWLARVIRAAGAAASKSVLPGKTTVVIADTLGSPRAPNLSESVSVATTMWVLLSIAAGRALPLCASLAFRATAQERNRAAAAGYDQFGDSVTRIVPSDDAMRFFLKSTVPLGGALAGTAVSGKRAALERDDAALGPLGPLLSPGGPLPSPTRRMVQLLRSADSLLFGVRGTSRRRRGNELSSEDAAFEARVVNELALGHNPFRFFCAAGPCRVYCLGRAPQAAHYLEFYGADLTTTLDDDVTHVVVSPAAAPAAVAQLYDQIRPWPRHPRVVTTAWVLASVRQRRCADTAAFVARRPRQGISAGLPLV